MWAGQALSERLLKYNKPCRGGNNVKLSDWVSAGSEKTWPMVWLLCSLAAHLRAGCPLQRCLTPRRTSLGLGPAFLDEPMPLRAFEYHMTKLQGADGKHFTGHSLRRGRAQDLVRLEGKSKGQVRVLLGHVSHPGVEDYLRKGTDQDSDDEFD